jgi:hypothetical protein
MGGHAFTPYELGIILHYYCRVDEHEQSPIFGETVLGLMSLGLMMRSTDPLYALTDRGRAFVEIGLLQTPLPVMRWVMPNIETGNQGASSPLGSVPSAAPESSSHSSTLRTGGASLTDHDGG